MNTVGKYFIRKRGRTLKEWRNNEGIKGREGKIWKKNGIRREERKDNNGGGNA